MGAPTIVIVPGLRDHVADHWQTHLQSQCPDAVTVPPLEHHKFSRAARVTALDEVLGKIQGPVLIVAHSAGVMTTVHWAQQPTRHIHAALLVTPADLEVPLPAGYPVMQTLANEGWLPIPRSALPFRSLVASSSNDPLGQEQRVRDMATAWGSELTSLGAVGHMNPAAGFGPWPGAIELIKKLT